MPTLSTYDHFDGRHWETGSVHNFFAARGFTAPHTGEPYSEALLLGVSGGVTFGYFTFHYEGYDPQCNILMRNTFDPLDTLLARLGVVQKRQQTASAERAAAVLQDTLAGGEPAIVWADRWSLPYNALTHDERMWGAFPLVVYGYEVDADVVHIADRAAVPLTVTTAELAAARGRIKKIRHRLLTLDAPRPEKLATAVRQGLADTVRLFTEKPPKGSANNFGLSGLAYWAKMLREPKGRKSWARLFPAGPALYAGLTSAYEFALLFGKGTAGDAERGLYADFLDEAALLLEQPALRETAVRYRHAAAAWRELPALLLPDDVAPFAEARDLLNRRHALFLEQGGAAQAEIVTINERLAALRRSMETGFPLTEAEAAAQQEGLAEAVLRIRAAEETAVLGLKEALESE
jgi:hypothetical protein